MNMDIKDIINRNENINKVDSNAFILDKIDDAKRYMSLNKFKEARVSLNFALRVDKYNTDAWLAKYELLKSESIANHQWIDDISNVRFNSVISSSVLESYMKGLKESNNKNISAVIEACNEISSYIEKYNAFKVEHDKYLIDVEERYTILERKINEYLGNKRIERVKELANAFNMTMTAGTAQYGESCSFIYDLSDTEMFFYTVQGHPARYKSNTPMYIDEKEKAFYKLAPKFENKEVSTKKKFLGIFG